MRRTLEMPGTLPSRVLPGQIYRHARFYRDAEGRRQTKYLTTVLSPDILCLVLGCVANADDTTRQQECLIRDQRAILCRP